MDVRVPLLKLIKNFLLQGNPQHNGRVYIPTMHFIAYI